MVFRTKRLLVSITEIPIIIKINKSTESKTLEASRKKYMVRFVVSDPKLEGSFLFTFYGLIVYC